MPRNPAQKRIFFDKIKEAKELYEKVKKKH